VLADVFCIISIIIASGTAATLQRYVSRPQAELRLEGPKMKAAGRYYDKDQADRERSEVACSLYSQQQHAVWVGDKQHNNTFVSLFLIVFPFKLFLVRFSFRVWLGIV